MISMLKTLFAYNKQRNKRVLEQAAKLTQEQFDAPSKIDEMNLRELLYHTMRTEWGWRSMAEKGTLPGPPPELDAFSTVEDLQTRWLEEDKAMGAYLESLSEEELKTVMELPDPKGNVHHFTRWGMLMHVLMHSMQHRSEAAVVLTEFGFSPGDMDLIYFLMGPERG